MIGTSTSIAARQQWVTLQNPSGPAVPDGDGNTVSPAYVALSPPAVFGSLRPPTQEDLERLAAGTVIATGQRVFTCPFHPGVTSQTRLGWTDDAGRAHVANVIGVGNPDGRCVETVALCVEIVL